MPASAVELESAHIDKSQYCRLGAGFIFCLLSRPKKVMDTMLVTQIKF